MKKSHRTGLVIALALLCLVITAMLLSHFFTRGMPGTVATLPAATEPTAGAANDESAGAPSSSTLAFNLDLDSGGLRDGMKSDRLRGIPTGGDVGGSENGAGSGGSNFGDVLFVGTNGNGGFTPFGGGTGGWFGGIGSGGPGSGGPGSGGGPGGGGPGNGNGPSGNNGPFSNGPSNDDPHFVGDNPPFGGGNGNGPIGPIAGGGGPGGGSGSGGPGGGGSGNGGGPGDGGPGTGGSPGTGGNGSGGGPGGIQDPDRFFSDNGPGGNGDGPSNTTPIPTSNGSVPAPPSIFLVIGGVGLLLGAAKLRRPGNRS